ncbi:MAG: UDP-N-acetylmuramoyl-tripeptide--D-alanyl-D-alanine ligase [Cereibacter sphaeroides]|uniref:UDP-N-acetylmuramoyl-tripeptide--D-alanyl-D-alanine ligase n=1 Tax=Cereibacter sphaeroides TaxID=1063 RepID=A0A2W5S9X8_CERSP|nr:MAG: UDP-N-acetylmuramoyl-tripeptide--D-alanyl-D-alanine ligase [Cereibacter sphaeroides]
MTPLWSSSEAARATGGAVAVDWQATGVSIDTRTLKPGDLFVALKDLRDGHDFVAQALAKGAAAALVTHRPEGVATDAPLLVVPDVLAGLSDLARAARARTKAKVVGVTGSVGKTSTKDMLAKVLGGQGKTHAAEASYNNHWGVPLTLARMAVDTDFAVIEIGMNHSGEIAPLAILAQLDVALITTVAPAHLEAFDSLEGIATEKATIMDGLIAGGTAVLPADISTAGVLLAKARATGARVIRVGYAENADFRLTDVQLTPDATVVQASAEGRPILFKIMTPGRHFAPNALAVLAVASALGLDPTLAAMDLGRWAPPAGRGTRERILLDPVEDQGFELIDDAFNANPASMAASLEVLSVLNPVDGVGRVGAGRRIAVLGDMLELGPTEAELHTAIARLPALEKIAVIHSVGPRMRALHAALPPRQRGIWTETATDLAGQVRGLVDAGDIVLVKGSKGIKVSLVVDALRKLGQAVARDQQGTD